MINRFILFFVLSQLSVLAFATEVENLDSSKKRDSFNARLVGGTYALVGAELGYEMGSLSFDLEGSFLPGSSAAFNGYTLRVLFSQETFSLDSWKVGYRIGSGFRRTMVDTLQYPHPFSEQYCITTSVLLRLGDFSVEVGPAVAIVTAVTLFPVVEISWRVMSL